MEKESEKEKKKIYKYESVSCTPETSTTLYINYTSKNKIK